MEDPAPPVPADDLLAPRGWVGRLARALAEGEWIHPGGGPAGGGAAPLEAVRLARAALALEGTYREVLVLRFREGLPYGAIAPRMNLPAEEVEARLERALDLLRMALDRVYEGDTAARTAALLALAHREEREEEEAAGGPTAASPGERRPLSPLFFAAVALLLAGGGVLLWALPSGPTPGTSPGPPGPEASADPAAPPPPAPLPVPRPAPPAPAPSPPAEAPSATAPPSGTGGEESGKEAESSRKAESPGEEGGGDGRRSATTPLDLTGRLLDAGTRAPLPGFRVLVTPAGGRAGGPRPEPLQATTGGDGTFSFGGLPPGPCRIEVSNDAPDCEYAAESREGVPAGTRDVEFALPRGLAIAGRLVDEDGRPVATRVALFAQGLAPDGSPDPARTRAGVGGADGRFRLPGLRAGRYLLTVSPAPGAGAVGYVVKRVPAVEAGSADLAVVLARGRTVAGRVVAEGGGPPRGRGRITATPSGGDPAAPSLAQGVDVREDGTFESAPLDASLAWDLVASGFPGATGGEVRGVRPGARDVVLRLRAGGAITGRVLDREGAPLAGIPVSARAAGATLRNPGEAAFASSGADGTFALRGLGPHRFRVEAGVGSEYLRMIHPSEVEPGGSVEFRLAKGARVAGRLVDAAGGAARADRVVAEAAGREDPAGSPVGPDGSFDVRGVPPGRVSLVALVGGRRIPLGAFTAPAEGLAVVLPAE